MFSKRSYRYLIHLNFRRGFKQNEQFQLYFWDSKQTQNESVLTGTDFLSVPTSFLLSINEMWLFEQKGEWLT